MFLNGTEYKFRGDNQLLELIAKNYSAIKAIVPDSAFEVHTPDLPDWTKVDSELEQYEQNLPEDLSNLEVVKRDSESVYFNYGIDYTGQEHYIKYYFKEDRLTLAFNSSEESNYNPSIEDYDVFNKKLKKYLKKCEKEQQNEN